MLLLLVTVEETTFMTMGVEKYTEGREHRTTDRK
jgi:hypothetical protein